MALSSGADLGVVLGLLDGGRGADRLEEHEVVLAAGRDAVLDDVRHGQVGLAQDGVGRGLVGFGCLDLVGQVLGPGQDSGTVLGVGLGHRPADRLLFPAQRVRPRHRSPAGVVGGEQGVDEGFVLAADAL